MTNLENVRDVLLNIKFAFDQRGWSEYSKEVQKALSELEAYMENDGWLPIESADKKIKALKLLQDFPCAGTLAPEVTQFVNKHQRTIIEMAEFFSGKTHGDVIKEMIAKKHGK